MSSILVVLKGILEKILVDIIVISRMYKLTQTLLRDTLILLLSFHAPNDDIYLYKYHGPLKRLHSITFQ